MEQREDGVLAGVTVVRKAVRSARLQVQPDGTLRVVAPASFNVEEFLQRNVVWIEEQRAKYDRLAAAGRGKEDRLLLHGEFYRVLPGVRFAIDGASGCVTSPSTSILKRNLTRMLKEEVSDRLKDYPDLVGKGVGRISIKLQRTRWGSCSSLGNLNINLRTVALPETLREYIVIHEATHLREQNHSARFWKLVEDHYPDHRTAEAELRRYWVILERNRVWRSLQDAP
ncbi:MAG: M48 family metallopeptidase [Methanomicrobiales archaeon]|jgi:predicted metal-dependent hydrolase|nr:M48 family metallopeptidase [Methanomicrobiales archaeon]